MIKLCWIGRDKLLAVNNMSASRTNIQEDSWHILPQQERSSTQECTKRNWILWRRNITADRMEILRYIWLFGSCLFGRCLWVI